MSKLEKAKNRILWVRFYREIDQKIIRFHKPHNKNILNKETIKDIVSTLIISGDL